MVRSQPATILIDIKINADNNERCASDCPFYGDTPGYNPFCTLFREDLTAGSPLSSSGGTSELSKWPDAKTAMDSLMQTVPRNATVIVESTAFGVGGYFYNMWQRAFRHIKCLKYQRKESK